MRKTQVGDSNERFPWFQWTCSDLGQLQQHVYLTKWVLSHLETRLLEPCFMGGYSSFTENVSAGTFVLQPTLERKSLLEWSIHSKICLPSTLSPSRITLHEDTSSSSTPVPTDTSSSYTNTLTLPPPHYLTLMGIHLSLTTYHFSPLQCCPGETLLSQSTAFIVHLLWARLWSGAGNIFLDKVEMVSAS